MKHISSHSPATSNTLLLSGDPAVNSAVSETSAELALRKMKECLPSEDADDGGFDLWSFYNDFDLALE